MTRLDKAAILTVVALMCSTLGIAVGAGLAESPDCTSTTAARYARCAGHHQSAQAPTPVRGSCQEDDWCWSALVDGNHTGSYRP
jgi:hypothetical protein